MVILMVVFIDIHVPFDKASR